MNGQLSRVAEGLSYNDITLAHHHPPPSPQKSGSVFITTVPIIKMFAWGEGDSRGHVLRETTSLVLCGLVCPSRTSVPILFLTEQIKDSSINACAMRDDEPRSGTREEPGTLTQRGALFS